MNTKLKHRYTVEFRISAADLVPSQITQEMDLQPINTRLAGDPRGQSGAFSNGLWAFSGVKRVAGCPDEWETLEEGLLHVMLLLQPRKQLIASYMSRFDVYWWCAHFQNSFDGGPTFSSRLLRDLSDFGIPLMLDNYMSSD